ncbi:MAG: porin family protein [Afipia sp.]|nr:porin family protein [Afipia sp.]
MFRRFIGRGVLSAIFASALVLSTPSTKPASAYTITGGFGALGLLNGSFADVRDEQIKQMALAGATAAAIFAFDAVFSSTLGIPSLFEELSGTASRSNRGLLDAFAYAPEGDALAYGPRKRDRAAMITKAMAPRPVANWSGLYGGVNLGWGFGTSGWIDAFGDVAGIPGSSLGVRTNGVVGGLQAGVNFQSGRFVYGLEGTFSGSDIHGSTVRNLPPAVGTFSNRLNWLASITGRVGYTLPVTMFYVKGGAAFAEFENNMRLDGNAGPFVFPGQTATRAGWTVGMGAERALNDRLSLRYEWNYFDFGKQRYDTFLQAFGPARVDIDQTVHTVTVGLNYRFGSN